MDPILVVVLIGVVGGAVKSVLGYVSQAAGTAFDWIRFGKTLLLAGIVGGGVVYLTKIAGNPDVVLGTSSYIEAFLTSVGVASAADFTVEALIKKKITG